MTCSRALKPLVASTLVAGGVLASAVAVLASTPPVLSSVGVDQDNHLTASWTKPTSDDSYALTWSTDGSTGSDPFGMGAPLTSPLDSETLAFGVSSTVTQKVLPAGSYIVQVETRGDHASCVGGWCSHYSNVLPLTVPALAPPSDATGRFLRGTRVTIVRASGASETITGGASFSLFVGDRVTTGAGTLIELVADGGATVRVAERSTFSLDTASSAGGSLKNLVGNVWLQIVPGKRWTIRTHPSTSTAVIAVRGTVLTVEARRGWVRERTYSGLVTVRNAAGPVRQTVTVKRRFEAVLRGRRPPVTPRGFVPPRRRFWG